MVFLFPLLFFDTTLFLTTKGENACDVVQQAKLTPTLSLTRQNTALSDPDPASRGKEGGW